MAQYNITTSNWNDPSFWASIAQSSVGHTLNATGLPSNFTFDIDPATGLLTLSDGSTTFTVGDSIFGGTADATLGGSTEFAFFDIFRTPDGDDVVYGTSSANIIRTFAGDDFVDITPGGSNGDYVRTGNNDDTIIYGGRDVDIEAGGGNDYIMRHVTTNASDAAGVIDGGGGTDTFAIDGNFGTLDSDRHVDLSTESLLYSGSNRGTLLNFENIEIIDGGAQATGNYKDNVITASGNFDNFLRGFDGDDTIDGGGGDDEIVGGRGDDTLTGGSGSDLFRFSDGHQQATITDFNVADGDRLGVAGLTNAHGDPIHAWDVTTVDDGAGNAKLLFPSGEEVILQGIAPSAMSTPTQYQAAGIPCFTLGTMILTPRGEVVVQDLRPGDMVVTRDNGVQPIVWIGRRSLGPAELGLQPHLKPIEIKAGAFEGNRRLVVSPQHGVLMERDGTQALIRAVHLARLCGGKVRRMNGVRRVSYVHLMFDAHQIVFSNGMPSESYYPGPMARAGNCPDAAQEFRAIFPNLTRADLARTRQVYGAPARGYARKRDVLNGPVTLVH